MPGIRQLKNYFHFNRGERRGLVVLFVILLLLVLFNMLMPQFIPAPKHDLSAFRKAVASYEQQKKALDDSLQAAAIMAEETKVLRPWPFDPNALSAGDWVAMGLTERQARVIQNYLKKGGRFRQPADLKKIYSISDKEYKALLPYIRIKKPQGQDTEPIAGTVGRQETAKDRASALHDTLNTAHLKKQQPRFPVSPTNRILELNRADTSTLQGLYGIGPAFARRIVNYRDLLGGYVDPEQLLEVYGFDSTRYQGLIGRLWADTSIILKLPVNEAGIGELVRHPYIDYHLARLIVNEREQAGVFLTLEDLKTRLGLPAGILERLLPYLAI